MVSIADSELPRLLELIKGADSVELKLSVPDAHAPLRDRGARTRPARRPDTPGGLLRHAGPPAQPRRRRGPGPPGPEARRTRSSSCVRSCPTSCGEQRRSPGFGVEVDAMPGGFVCSASLKATLGRRPVKRSPGSGPRSCSPRSSGPSTPHAPDGLELDDLSVLGPIIVLKLKFAPKELDGAGGRRAVDLPRRIAPARAVDQVHPERGVRRRRRGEGVPRLPRPRPRRRAADQDAQGAGVPVSGVR